MFFKGHPQVGSTTHRPFTVKCAYSVGSSTGKYTDVLIIGGGVIGSSVASFLSRRAREKNISKSITVVEKDYTYKSGATTRSAGSIRHQFSHPLNIQMSQFGTQFFREIKEHLSFGTFTPDITFKEGGYLFLASPEGAPILQSNHQTQTSLGANIALLTPSELSQRFPWLNLNGISLGTLGLSGEGWLDPFSLTVAFKKHAEHLGVNFLQNEVVSLRHNQHHISQATLKDGTEIVLNEGGVVVNAAGVWGRQILQMVGDDIPVRARKRCIFVLDCKDKEQLLTAPLVIDITGAYCRPEGQKLIAGIAPAPEVDFDVPHDDFSVDYSLWEDVAWPILANRIPLFEEVKLVHAWAGHYDYNTVDQNAIIGQHSVVKNLYLANGFSGHGLQQSPAVGRALSELILDGHYISLDLTPLSLERIKQNRPLKELNIV